MILNFEYEIAEKIILVLCIRWHHRSFTRNALQSYSMLSHQPKNDSETSLFHFHISKLVLMRIAIRTNISFFA